ncbi:MAG: 4-diphosphocytidyl-2-C-methyl-D-erythritol kinase [Candidatus Magnetoglobus multicellularis str. Araruama]|uniref:4-(cytidine 5'-diphospho)-2-C-methyl-D-erythritol kinase n=1 Tax=Candidatus Magnetoglobus multicellularis str. Araruama TaxID=890399 RepID=A0A1V1PG24_9BACT|nr:MAG: 4-diphosphocytidyl-2-C-methyl-D-erythritol kinase [Candidatus Magnetoglobus multicellularis str. Araruama]
MISLICPVSLYDRITIQFQTSTMQVISNNPSIPDNENNLAYQASIKFFNAIDSRDCINIEIEKNIPVGAGLGGGSSNAATVLMALNQWYQSPLSHEKLQQIALSLGADVPFFLQKSTALATGIGECLYPVDLDIKQSLIILYPGFSISTAWAFKNFKIPLTKKN